MGGGSCVGLSREKRSLWPFELDPPMVPLGSKCLEDVLQSPQLALLCDSASRLDPSLGHQMASSSAWAGAICVQPFGPHFQRRASADEPPAHRPGVCGAAYTTWHAASWGPGSWGTNSPLHPKTGGTGLGLEGVTEARPLCTVSKERRPLAALAFPSKARKSFR